MRVLGVDPGLVRTGWAVVDLVGGSYRLVASGLIAPPTGESLEARLAHGFAGIEAVLERFSPSLVVMEDLFSARQHPRSALLMAHMRGVLCMAAGRRGLTVEPMTATTVKQRVTGNGHASKEQVREMVARLCEMPAPDQRVDVTDAIAVAVAGLNQVGRSPTSSPRDRRAALLALVAERAR